MTEKDICETCKKIIENGEGRICKPPKWVLRCMHCDWMDTINAKERRSHQKLTR